MFTSAGLGYSVHNQADSGQLNKQPSRLDSIKQSKVIRAGYAVYSPYVQKDLQTGELSGYSIDITNEIANQMGFKVEYIEGSWQTAIADLKADKFDLLIGPLFSTIPRAMEIDYPTPYSYVSSLAAIVKRGDVRFDSITSLNQSDIVISVPQGWFAHEYANKYLTKATIRPYQDSSGVLALTNVVSGNADIALADSPTVQQYLENNPNQDVKGLFLDSPIAVSPAGFGIKQGDDQWLNFLSLSIQVMKTDGTLKQLASKYHLYSLDLETKYLPQ